MECSYRNCKKELINKRKDAKFCCRKCKGYEKTYINRYNSFLETSISINKNIIDGYKKIKELIEKKD